MLLGDCVTPAFDAEVLAAQVSSGADRSVRGEGSAYPCGGRREGSVDALRRPPGEESLNIPTASTFLAMWGHVLGERKRRIVMPHCA